jgi:hypothetical protein
MADDDGDFSGLSDGSLKRKGKSRKKDESTSEASSEVEQNITHEHGSRGGFSLKRHNRCIFLES